jgi:hypothetical protein
MLQKFGFLTQAFQNPPLCSRILKTIGAYTESSTDLTDGPSPHNTDPLRFPENQQFLLTDADRLLIWHVTCRDRYKY